MEELAIKNITQKIEALKNKQLEYTESQIPRSQKEWAQIINKALEVEGIEAKELYTTLRARRLRNREINGVSKLYLRPINNTKLYDINNSMVTSLYKSNR